MIFGECDNSSLTHLGKHKNLILFVRWRHKVGLPTVQDSPARSRNWPTVSRVPGKVDFVPELLFFYKSLSTFNCKKECSQYVNAKP